MWGKDIDTLVEKPPSFISTNAAAMLRLCLCLSKSEDMLNLHVFGSPFMHRSWTKDDQSPGSI